MSVLSDKSDDERTVQETPVPDVLDAGRAADVSPAVPPPVNGRLTRLWDTLGVNSVVLLREPDSGNHEPVVQPQSSEIPAGGAGKYQVLGEIAHGGMGAVLRARDADLGRDLALKVLLAKHRREPDTVRRFLEEAQINGQLQHP